MTLPKYKCCCCWIVGNDTMSVWKCLIDFLLSEMLCIYVSEEYVSEARGEEWWLRLGRPTSTSSALREKQVVLTPLADRGRGGGARDLLVLMMWGPHRHRQVDPRRWTRRSISGRRIRLIMWSLNNIILMCINNISITLILSRSMLILSSR